MAEDFQFTRGGNPFKGGVMSSEEYAMYAEQMAVRQTAIEAEIAGLEAEVAESSALLAGEEVAEAVEAGIPIVGWVAAAATAVLIVATVAAIIYATARISELQAEAATLPRPKPPGRPEIAPAPTRPTIGPSPRVEGPVILPPRRLKRVKGRAYFITVPHIAL